jgi:antitoxin component of MazEF toxin-antitoxin module
MASKIVRIRDRNQVTLPPEVMEAVSLRAGDFLEVSVTSEGTLTLAPKRLVTWNTPEAEEADQEAERDIAAKRFATFDSAKAFTEDLLGAKRPSAEPQPKRAAARIQRKRLLKALQASRGSTDRAARILGIDPKKLALWLKEHRLPERQKS